MVFLHRMHTMIKAFFLFASVYIISPAIFAETITTPSTLNQQSHIRIIAASCAACHGTNGNSVGTTPTLAGLDSGYFVTQMQAFKQGERSPTVMHHHAKGLTMDEINLLALYFSEQKRITHAIPQSEQLKDQHGR